MKHSLLSQKMLLLTMLYFLRALALALLVGTLRSLMTLGLRVLAVLETFSTLTFASALFCYSVSDGRPPKEAVISLM